MLGCKQDRCAVCARWPAADREGMRMLVDSIPLREPVCEDCVMAFWRTLIEAIEPSTRH